MNVPGFNKWQGRSHLAQILGHLNRQLVARLPVVITARMRRKVEVINCIHGNRVENY